MLSLTAHYSIQDHVIYCSAGAAAADLERERERQRLMDGTKTGHTHIL